jgi:methylmalonyl-CoA/ethylmalonyl-CoA epimerase
MLKVDKLLHVSHAIADNRKRPEVENFYLDIFAAQTFYEGRPMQGLERDETLTLIGMTQIIPIAPTDDRAPVAQTIKSFAPGFMGMAMKVADLGQTDAHVRAAGLHPNYTDPIFNEVFFLTRPEETLGISFEFCVVEMPNDLRLRPEWSADWWRDAHPLGVEKLSCISTATGDLDAASSFYRDVFGFRQIHEGELAAETARVAAFAAADFIIEVLQPVKEGTPLADFVKRRPQGVYALNFKVKSAANAAKYLQSKNLRLLGDERSRFTIDPADSHGARYIFSDRQYPNDPRP